MNLDYYEIPGLVKRPIRRNRRGIIGVQYNENLFHRVKEAVEDVTGIGYDKIVESHGNKEIRLARGIFVNIIKNRDNVTYEALGVILGGRKHDVILKLFRATEGFIQINDRSFCDMYKKVVQKLDEQC